MSIVSELGFIHFLSSCLTGVFSLSLFGVGFTTARGLESICVLALLGAGAALVVLFVAVFVGDVAASGLLLDTLLLDRGLLLVVLRAEEGLLSLGKGTEGPVEWNLLFCRRYPARSVWSAICRADNELLQIKRFLSVAGYSTSPIWLLCERVLYSSALCILSATSAYHELGPSVTSRGWFLCQDPD